MHEPTLNFANLKSPDGSVWTPEKLDRACTDKVPDENTQAALSKLIRGFEACVRLEDKGSLAAFAKMEARLSAGGYREDDFSETFDALQHMGGQVEKFALYKLDVDLACFRAFDRIQMRTNLKKFWSMDEVFTVEELLEDTKLPFQQKQGEEITVTTVNYGTAAKFSKFFIRDNTWADVPATLAKVPRYRIEHLTDQMWAAIFLATNYGRSSSATPGTPYETGIDGDDTAAEKRDKRMIALNDAYIDMVRTQVPLVRTDGTKVKVHGKIKYFAPFWQPSGEVLIFTSIERKATIDNDLAYFANPDNAGAENPPIARYRVIGTTKGDASDATYDDCIMIPPKGTHKYLPYTNIARGKDQSAMTFSTEYAFDWSHGLAHFGNIAAEKVFSGRIIQWLTTVKP